MRMPDKRMHHQNKNPNVQMTSEANQQLPRVAWWCKSTDLKIASVRMRAAILMRSMSQQGVHAGWFTEKDASDFNCVVVSKRYDDETLLRLRRFKQAGGRVVIDLCDNHFVAASQSQKHLHQVENLRAMVGLAHAVVTSAEPLAQIVLRECPGVAQVVVIGDVPDDLSIVQACALRRAWAKLIAARERSCLNQLAPEGVTRLVWFGNSAGRQKKSGMTDLARVLPILEKLNKTHPLNLTVISNSKRLYKEQIACATLPSRYVEWDALTFEAVLSDQHIALIPATPNEFTSSKSDNRVVTAMRAGLAVVADPVPSYLAHGDVIHVGDIEGGLRHYLNDPALRAQQSLKGRERALLGGLAERVVAQWLLVTKPDHRPQPIGSDGPLSPLS